MSGLDLSGLFKRDVKSVSLFGFGRSAVALIPHLLSSGYSVTVRDDRAIDTRDLPSGVGCLSGASALKNVTEDVMIISPSTRRDRFFTLGLDKRMILTSDTEIFFKAFTGKCFAISGSSGKSTTSTLLYELLSGSGAHLIGNIGVPMTHALLTKNITRAVCEISSFNLEYDEIRAYRATVTNIKRNHLNWHTDFDEYVRAKLSLLSSATWFSANLDDEYTRSLSSLSSCYACYSLKFDHNSLQKLHKDKIIFTRGADGIYKNNKLIVPSSLISGYPVYNIYNLLAALSLAEGEYDEDTLPEIISSHRSLSHRCEKFLTERGVDFIDSSIDTSPDRTYETLSSLSDSVILMLGGRSKGESYSPLVSAVNKKCKSLYLFGEARDKILSDMAGAKVPIYLFKTMREATLAALSASGVGDTLLLSPASTSFDEFSSFEVRGDSFKKIVKDALGQENTGEENEKVN